MPGAAFAHGGEQRERAERDGACGETGHGSGVYRADAPRIVATCARRCALVVALLLALFARTPPAAASDLAPLPADARGIDVTGTFARLIAASGLHGVIVARAATATDSPCQPGTPQLPCVDAEARRVYLPEGFLGAFPEPDLVKAALAHELGHLRLGHRPPTGLTHAREADLDGALLLERSGTSAGAMVRLLDAVPRRASGLSAGTIAAYGERSRFIQGQVAGLPALRDELASAGAALRFGRFDDAVRRLEGLGRALPMSNELATDLGLAHLGRHLQRSARPDVWAVVRKALDEPADGRVLSPALIAAALARRSEGRASPPFAAGGLDTPVDLLTASAHLDTAYKLGPTEPRALIHLVGARGDLAAACPVVPGSAREAAPWCPSMRGSARELAAELEDVAGSWADPRDRAQAWLTLDAYRYLLGRRGGGELVGGEAGAGEAEDGDEGATALATARALLLEVEGSETRAEQDEGMAAFRRLFERVRVDGPAASLSVAPRSEGAEGDPAPRPDVLAFKGDPAPRSAGVAAVENRGSPRLLAAMAPARGDCLPPP